MPVATFCLLVPDISPSGQFDGCAAFKLSMFQGSECCLFTVKADPLAALVPCENKPQCARSACFLLFECGAEREDIVDALLSTA